MHRIDDIGNVKFKTIMAVAKIFLLSEFENNGVRAIDIYRKTKLTYDSVHKIVKELERKKLVCSRRDGRQVFYNPTKNGREFFTSIVNASNALNVN